MFFESPQHIAPTCKYCRTLNSLELYPTLAPWITIFAASALSFRVGVKHQKFARPLPLYALGLDN